MDFSIARQIALALERNEVLSDERSLRLVMGCLKLLPHRPVRWIREVLVESV